MARMNVYVPDDLAEEARSAGLNVSALTQEAIRNALRESGHRAWLERVKAAWPEEPLDPAIVRKALDDVRADAGKRPSERA